MRLGRIAFISACVLAGSLPLIASTRSHRGTTSHKPTTRAALKRTSVKPRIIGQRAIDDERATELQQALVKAGYLTGEPSGHWDAATEAAMTKLQADNGWQTKLVPDSRAIIKLGLGPSSTHPAPDSPAADETGSVTGTGNGLVAVR
jgi:hypothetical protein